MRRLGLLLIVLMLVALNACRSQPAASDLLGEVKQRGYLTVGVKYDSPPFGYLNAKGQLEGYEIDLAHELAKRILGKPEAIHFVQVHSSTRIAALQSKQVDFVLATMTITPKRAEVVNFTKPYFLSGQGMMVKADSPFQALPDLGQKKITFVIGGTGEANLKKALPQAELIGFKASTEAFSAFDAGRADAFSTDISILSGFVQQHCGVRLLKETFSEESYGIAFRKDAASRSLQDTVQADLDALKSEGFFDQLQAKWHKPKPPEHCPDKAA